MTLEELAHKVDLLLSHCGQGRQVVVTLDTPSMGARACANVVDICNGIDWEASQVRIAMDKPSMEKNEDSDVPMPKAKTPNGYVCRACWCFVRKHDKYCSTCGQNVEGVTE